MPGTMTTRRDTDDAEISDESYTLTRSGRATLSARGEGVSAR